MKLNELLTEDRAVSPVVGVALLIAITVILAAVIGGVVLGLGTGGVDTPQAQLTADFDAGADDLINIDHSGGEPLPAGQVAFVVDGNETTLEEAHGEDLTAGQTAELEDADGDATIDANTDEVTVLWEDPNSDSTTVLAEFEA